MMLPVFSGPCFCSLSVPGSKSITNRLFPLAVLSKTPLTIDGALESEDAAIMRNALTTMQASVQQGKNQNQWIVSAKNFFTDTQTYEIFCGNSGTTLRFLTALCALRKAPTILTGVERMKERPIGDLVLALQQLGVTIEYLEKKGFPPLKIFPPEKFSASEITLSGKMSSQFFTALFHIAPTIGLTIHVKDTLVSIPYVDMTIKMLSNFGIEVRNENYQTFTIAKQHFIAPDHVQTEADASSASYPLAIGAITKGDVKVENIPKDSLQGDAKFYETVIAKMYPNRGEPLLPLGEINMEHMPDVAMTAVVLSAYAKGYSKITGLSTLRHKECDRLFALESNLKKMGAKVNTGEDWIEIWGDPKKLHGADIECFGDHRVAMCFAVLGSVVEGVNILDPDCTKKTYPSFWEDFKILSENTK